MLLRTYDSSLSSLKIKIYKDIKIDEQTDGETETQTERQTNRKM